MRKVHQGRRHFVPQHLISLSNLQQLYPKQLVTKIGKMYKIAQGHFVLLTADVVYYLQRLAVSDPWEIDQESFNTFSDDLGRFALSAS